MANTDVILVNGVQMTIKEFKNKYSKTNPKKKNKRKINERNLIVEEMFLIKKIKGLKSLTSFYRNAYRQWGSIAKEIINNKDIERPFILYISYMKDIDNILANIRKYKNEKSLFNEIENLSYRLDDIKKIINELSDCIIKSQVINQYSDKEIINGEGRRLGLKILVKRTFQITSEIQDIIKKCKSYQ